ncbi:MAG: hypothetical protein ACO1NW_05530 [Chitinophagaceae bacterium]
MKQFLKKTSVFLFIVAAFATVTDLVVTNALQQVDKGDLASWNKIYNKQLDAEVLIYGSSRARVHFDPRVFKSELGVSAYNMGIDGHNFVMQKARHDAILRNNAPPKLIILSVDYYTLNKREDLFNPNQFLPYILQPEIRDVTSHYVGLDIYDYYLPMARYIGHQGLVLEGFRSMLGKKLIAHETYNGFVPQFLQWDNKLETLIKEKKRYETIVDNRYLKLLRDFLIDCRNKGINVLMVYAPEYITGQQFVKGRENMMAVFNQLSGELKVPFWDFSTDPLSKDKSLFYNALHLNAKGADLFTSKFVQMLSEKKELYMHSPLLGEK